MAIWVELLQHLQKGHKVVAGPSCRVKEVGQVGAGHIQVESTVPFQLPLSLLWWNSWGGGGGGGGGGCSGGKELALGRLKEAHAQC